MGVRVLVEILVILSGSLSSGTLKMIEQNFKGSISLNKRLDFGK